MTRRRLRGELRFLRVSALLSTCSLAIIAAAAFRSAQPQKFDEITVQRVNVTDASGTLRLVIAGRDRMHPGVMDGKTIDRARPVAGLIFFNDEGDEVGGLTFTGQEKDGHRRADAGLMFDQLKQDQTVGLSYTESDGVRTAGLRVWDRPETHLSEVFDKVSAAQRLQDPAAREAALKALAATTPQGRQRVFVGKTRDKSAVVSLADAEGRTRVNLKVDADGTASLEFLDAAGKVVQRLPQQR